MQVYSTHVAPPEQVPHDLPQPSSPHCLSAQFGTHVPLWHMPNWLQVLPEAQEPHELPQPSSPHCLPPQDGVQDEPVGSFSPLHFSKPLTQPISAAHPAQLGFSKPDEQLERHFANTQPMRSPKQAPHFGLSDALDDTQPPEQLASPEHSSAQPCAMPKISEPALWSMPSSLGLEHAPDGRSGTSLCTMCESSVVTGASSPVTGASDSSAGASSVDTVESSEDVASEPAGGSVTHEQAVSFLFSQVRVDFVPSGHVQSSCLPSSVHFFEPLPPPPDPQPTRPTKSAATININARINICILQ